MCFFFTENHWVMPEYFCTVGFGLEHFAADELAALTGVTVRLVLVGKVFFLARDPIPGLLTLKTVERLFVQVIHAKVDKETDTPPEQVVSDETACLSIEDWLRKKVADDRVAWLDCVSCWKGIAGASGGEASALKFRVNSKLSGRFRKLHNYRRVSSLVADFLVENLHLVADLHEPDVEVVLHLNDEYLTVGLPLTPKPLSLRSYLPHIAVRLEPCFLICGT